MITLTPVSSLATVAVRSLAVFDLDGTVAPNTGYLFWKHVWGSHPASLVSGPFNLPGTFQWVTNPKAVLKRLERARETDVFETLAREFAASGVERHIYARSAEEIAWRRANLQAVVVVTGGFDAFVEPIYRRLKADRVHSNARFLPMAVRGEKKPGILKEHYLNDSAGFHPQAVYTDSHSDRFMVEAFDWPEVHLVNPDRKLRRMVKPHWRVLDPNVSNPNFPEAVRDYAATVIRGKAGAETTLDFYRRWNQRIETTSDPSPEARRDFLAVAGLYLKETPETRGKIVEALGDRFEVRSIQQYGGLISANDHCPLPLDLIGP